VILDNATYLLIWYINTTMPEMPNCPISEAYTGEDRTRLILALNEYYDLRENINEPHTPPAITQYQVDQIKRIVMTCVKCHGGRSCNLGSLVLGNRQASRAAMQQRNPFAWYYS